jgi:hypothetical protein
LKEQELADLLCLSERKVRDLRETYLDEEKHWHRNEVGEVEYLPDGLAAMAGTLGLEVGALTKAVQEKTAQDAPEAVEALPGQDPAAPTGATGQAAPAVGLIDEVTKRPMVRVAVVRRLPNARWYVARVSGTRRIVRLRTKARMGLGIGRALWCLDMGDEVVFDRRAARVMGAKLAGCN